MHSPPYHCAQPSYPVVNQRVCKPQRECHPRPLLHPFFGFVSCAVALLIAHSARATGKFHGKDIIRPTRMLASRFLRLQASSEVVR